MGIGYESNDGTIYMVRDRAIKGTYGIFEQYRYGFGWHECSLLFPSRWWRHKENAEKFLEKYASEHGWKKITY